LPPHGLDALGLLIVELSEFVFASGLLRRSSSSLAWMARVSRCSERWMNTVIIQVARVAMACQLKVSRSNRNQSRP
jgi:hypothetical protein